MEDQQENQQQGNQQQGNQQQGNQQQEKQLLPTLQDYQSLQSQLTTAQQQLGNAQNQTAIYRSALSEGCNPEVLAKLIDGLKVEVTSSGLLVEGQSLSDYAKSNWESFKSSLFPHRFNPPLPSGSPIGAKPPQKEKSVVERYIEKTYPRPNFLK